MKLNTVAVWRGFWEANHSRLGMSIYLFREKNISVCCCFLVLFAKPLVLPAMGDRMPGQRNPALPLCLYKRRHPDLLFRRHLGNIICSLHGHRDSNLKIFWSLLETKSSKILGTLWDKLQHVICNKRDMTFLGETEMASTVFEIKLNTYCCKDTWFDISLSLIHISRSQRSAYNSW